MLLCGLAGAVMASCEARLPEPDSAAAQLYRQRCSGCHRLYHPGLLTPEMWRFMLARMDIEFVRVNLPPLSDTEKAQLLDYLTTHGRTPPRSTSDAPPRSAAESYGPATRADARGDPAD